MSTVLKEINQKVALVTINRPKALNALNQQVLEDLNQVITELEKEKDLRCVIITGSGDKAFVAGADIKEMTALNNEQAIHFAEKGQKVFRRLEVLSCPVIAAVNGFALGGGCELAMACDFIYASDNAVFGLPEVSLGLMPGFGGTQRLHKYIGVGKAKEYTYTAKKIKASEAKELGLVNEIFEPQALLEMTKQTAAKIAKLAPIAISASKGAINQGYDIGIDPGLHLERTLFGELFRSKDMKIGTDAFVKKQKPEFIGE